MKDYKAALIYLGIISILVICFLLFVNTDNNQTELHKWWYTSYTLITKGDIVVFLMLAGFWLSRK